LAEPVALLARLAAGSSSGLSLANPAACALVCPATTPCASRWTSRLVELCARPAAAGILVRPFAGQPGWLRFGLPGSDAASARLDRALG
jgi:hypothetical protein